MQHVASLTFLLIFAVCFSISSRLAKYRKSVPFIGFLAAVPFVVAYAIPPTLQDSVGVDFDTYKEIYDTQNLSFYWLKLEYGFAALAAAFHYLGFGFREFLFFNYAIMAINLFIFLSRCGREGGNAVLIMFLLFSVSGIYFNQMNILRQLVALSFFLAAIAFMNRKPLAFLSFLLMVSFHFISIILAPMYYIVTKIPKHYPTLFISGFLFWSIALPLGMTFVISTFFPTYEFYLTYEKGGEFINLATKIYWLPIYLLFVFFRPVRLSSRLMSSEFGERLSLFSVLTYWCFAGSILFPNLDRLNHFFTVFYIVPTYAVLFYLSKRGLIPLFLGLAYVVTPIIAKLFIFPSKEYHYLSIVF